MDKSKTSWKKFGVANIFDKTQYCSSEFKNLRYEIKSVEIVGLAEFLSNLL